jgi:hypothetical protein
MADTKSTTRETPERQARRIELEAKALRLADEAKVEPDPGWRRSLEQQALRAWRDSRVLR